MWTEKYRPSQLKDIKGHRKIKELFAIAVEKQCKGFPPIILYGPPGTGKTSFALALANETYPTISPSISTLYLNASDERSIEVIRDRILHFTETSWPGVTRKFVIFDEVETMTEPAQASLRALLDEVDKEGHTHSPLFLFLCNSLYRVHQAIRSRCIALFCGHIPIVHVRDTLHSIQKQEGIPEDQIKIPSELTFQIQRGDLRSFVASAQFGKDMNSWDKWFESLENAKSSLCVWEQGLKQVPFCILTRHVFLYMNHLGMLDPTFDKAEHVQNFVQGCLVAQDSSNSTILVVIPPLWDAIKNKHVE